MGEFFLLLIAALVVGAIVFGVAVLVTGDDPGIEGLEPDGRAVPLPSSRPLSEGDVSHVRFDTVIRGYRMSQVDAALRRAAYDIGYKEELIQVLEAELKALRDGRIEDADALRDARQAAVDGAGPAPAGAGPGVEPAETADAAEDTEPSGTAESSGSTDSSGTAASSRSAGSARDAVSSGDAGSVAGDDEAAEQPATEPHGSTAAPAWSASTDDSRERPSQVVK